MLPKIEFISSASDCIHAMYLKNFLDDQYIYIESQSYESHHSINSIRYKEILMALSGIKSLAMQFNIQFNQ